MLSPRERELNEKEKKRTLPFYSSLFYHSYFYSYFSNYFPMVREFYQL
ncbi:MAG: hypothetical protein PWP57_342 [Candidatus Atribacteria bacterium]|nr:hypothetical protein [Candidatus Atribacteria bacterium]